MDLQRKHTFMMVHLGMLLGALQFQLEGGLRVWGCHPKGLPQGGWQSSGMLLQEGQTFVPTVTPRDNQAHLHSSMPWVWPRESTTQQFCW